MFRAVLPRATPRAALRAAGPKASNFTIPTSLFIGVSKRGYASEAGELSLKPLPSISRRSLLHFPDAIADLRLAGQQVTTIWLSSVAVSPVTLRPSRPVKRA